MSEPTAPSAPPLAQPVVVEIPEKPSQDAAIAPSIEAILLSTDKPVSGQRLAAIVGLGQSGEEEKVRGANHIRAAVALLNEQYEQTGRAFRIEPVAGGYRIMTLPRFGPVLEAFHGERERASLSRAALETLAIIAYKQPITRAALEAIRGVACGDILRSLIDRRLVTITGRAEELGRPLLYGTTRGFLGVFGLSSLKDLPKVEELRPTVGSVQTSESAAAAPTAQSSGTAE